MTVLRESLTIHSPIAFLWIVVTHVSVMHVLVVKNDTETTPLQACLRGPLSTIVNLTVDLSIADLDNWRVNVVCLSLLLSFQPSKLHQLSLLLFVESIISNEPDTTYAADSSLRYRIASPSLPKSNKHSTDVLKAIA